MWESHFYFSITRVILLLVMISNVAFSNSSSDSDTFSSTHVPFGTHFTKALVPFYMQSLVGSGTFEPETLFVNVTNQRCVSHIKYLVSQLEGIFHEPPKVPDTFVLQMADSWGKLPSGILSGHLTELGDFDECVQAQSLRGPKVRKIKGKYCLASLYPLETKLSNHFKNQVTQGSYSTAAVTLAELSALMQSDAVTGPLLPQVGTCFPASCSTQDVQQVLSNVLKALNLGVNVQPCAVEEKPEFTYDDVTMIYVLVVIGILCIIGTSVDAVLRNTDVLKSIKNGKGTKAILAFSLHTNTSNLLSVHVGSDDLSCLHGLRFLSMCWVVLIHTWSMMSFQFQPAVNNVAVKTMYKSGWPILMVVNGSVSVDTFFVISGVLVAYNLLKELDQSRKLNIPLLYLHRYLRLTPVYAVLVGIAATLMPHLGNGPNWHNIERESTWCKNNWWHNLLYINSIIDYRNGGADSNMCYGESWYLANDMLYYIVATLLVYVLWRWRNAGLVVLDIWLIQCTVQIAVLTARNNISPTFIQFIRADTIFLDIYMRPWTRSAPYTIGIVLGYSLYQAKKHPNLVRALPKWAIAAGWITSTAIALAVIFGPLRYFDPVNQDEAFGTPAVVAYASLHRSAWSVAIAWIIFACVHGYGGWVDRFLSWKPFMPLGRLTYCVYISSYHLQLIYSFVNYQPVRYSVTNMVFTYFSHLVPCLILGYLLAVTIELPFIRLARLLLPSSKGSIIVPVPVEEYVTPVDECQKTSKSITNARRSSRG